MDCLILNNTVQKIYCNFEDEYLSFIFFLFLILICICGCNTSSKRNHNEYGEIQIIEPPKYTDI